MSPIDEPRGHDGETDALVREEAPLAVEAEVEAELQRVVPVDFAVGDATTAAWLVRRIVAARSYKARVKLWAEAEQRRAEHEEQRLMYLYGVQLQRWAGGEIAKLKGRRRSIALPGGVIGFRTHRAALVIDDEQRALAWARSACPSAVVVVERLLKAPINEHFEKTGELPDGAAHVEPAHDMFYVK